ncbi:MAG: UDP-N-acetylmuramate--L-alanine ligase [Candidatus Omnitrophica bacterium]|nr:UDP-N-acetylmuramate--L-alanine ligase [Candidatus Omnitrophota bacterium]
MQKITELIPNKKVHFVGIGGVGMSGLAQLLLEQGYYVIGSDLKKTRNTDRLEALGATIFFSHRAENLKDVDIVVYSSCIREDNPELEAAKKKNIKIIKRGLLLAFLMQGKTGIVIAGAHGKTTTTSLISLLLNTAGMNPSFAIGADLDALGGNASHGLGEYFVAEADESDGSFLCLHPDYAVITNIDKEHLDYYQDMAHIVRTYAEFIANLNPQGILFCYGEDAHIKQALKSYKGQLVTYGFSEHCDARAINMSFSDMQSEFECIYRNEISIKFKLSVPGQHNILNALACIAVGIKLGIDLDIIQKALEAFKGAKRRFEVRSKNDRVIIVDDYAHHPTEINATLQAAKSWKNRRLVGVFQPHRYSRTKFLQEEFAHCFDCADQIIITDIYAASEQPIKGIAARTIYDQVKKSGHKNVFFSPRSELKQHLLDNVQAGDILMLLGAGDINDLSEELSENFSKQIEVN